MNEKVPLTSPPPLAKSLYSLPPRAGEGQGGGKRTPLLPSSIDSPSIPHSRMEPLTSPPQLAGEGQGGGKRTPHLVDQDTILVKLP